jgi:hypothetical protein
MSTPEDSPHKPTFISVENARPLHEPALERRRRLIKGGLSAPILMTLVSRRALGANSQCQTGSMAASSLNTSHALRYLPVCSGCKPPHWCQNQNFYQWRSPCNPITTTVGSIKRKATSFHSTATGFKSGPYGNMGTQTTLLQVLGGSNALASHIAAALLNANASLTPVLTPTAVRTIWNEYASKGYFSPTAGVKWYPSQIVNYLLTTQPL